MYWNTKLLDLLNWPSPIEHFCLLEHFFYVFKKGGLIEIP